MVTFLAFVATALATMCAQTLLSSYTRSRRGHLEVWAVAMAMFALASVALFLGLSTGWDAATFRVFYLFGAILNVPWLALGTLTLLTPTRARPIRMLLLVFSGFAAGVLLTATMEPVSGTAIPTGKDVFPVLPRVLAAVGSGMGALVIIAGALYSLASGRRILVNVCITAGTLTLSAGGLLGGLFGKDTSFVLSLALGIVFIYGGVLLASVQKRTSRINLTQAPEQPKSERQLVR